MTANVAVMFFAWQHLETKNDVEKNLYKRNLEAVAIVGDTRTSVINSASLARKHLLATTSAEKETHAKAELAEYNNIVKNIGTLKSLSSKEDIASYDEDLSDWQTVHDAYVEKAFPASMKGSPQGVAEATEAIR